MARHQDFRLILTTAAALGLSSCAVKDGRLDFTWWQDAAAPVMEDDVIIESGGSGYYRSAPAPAKVPQASLPKEEPDKKPEQVAATTSQQQPALQTPPRATSPAAAQPRPGVHLVQPGDTLSALARRYGTTVSDLVAANGMASANVPLRINQQLKLPTAGQAPAPAARPAAKPAAVPAPAKPAAAPASAARHSGTYTVKAGDTLYRISRQHGISPAALMQANGLTPETANTLRIGTILRIPAAP